MQYVIVVIIWWWGWCVKQSNTRKKLEKKLMNKHICVHIIINDLWISSLTLFLSFIVSFRKGEKYYLRNRYLTFYAVCRATYVRTYVYIFAAWLTNFQTKVQSPKTKGRREKIQPVFAMVLQIEETVMSTHKIAFSMIIVDFGVLLLMLLLSGDKYKCKRGNYSVALPFLKKIAMKSPLRVRTNKKVKQYTRQCSLRPEISQQQKTER